MNLNSLKQTLIIAELGVNHNGDLDMIYSMIDAAKQSGADAVKLQVMTGYDLVTPDLMFKYTENGKEIETGLAQMFYDFRVKEEWLEPIYQYAKQRDIICFATPFSKHTIELLEQVGNPIYKISSGDITHTPLIKAAAQTGKPLIISTGKSSLEDIGRAVQTVREQNNEQLALLHCVSVYPTPWHELNLRLINTLAETFHVTSGFSDHSEGYLSSVVAVSMGAKIIEKHFTLDKVLPGPDHWFSLNPQEFKQLVDSIRLAESMFGSNEKKIYPNEMRVNERASRSIVFARDMTMGELITEEDLDYKRPGLGLRPYEADKVIGLRLTRDSKKDDLVIPGDI